MLKQSYDVYTINFKKYVQPFLMLRNNSFLKRCYKSNVFYIKDVIKVKTSILQFLFNKV